MVDSNQTDMENAKIWDASETMLLAVSRLNMEGEFNRGTKKKSTLWTNVLLNIKESSPGFPYNKEEIQKKYNNMFVTYKRIKQRNSDNGRDITKWDYFKIFDEVYGAKHYITPPMEYLSTTLGDNDSSTEGDEPIERKPSSPDDYDQMEMENAKIWDATETRLLAISRLNLEDEFSSGKRKKNTLWRKVLMDIKAVNPDFPYNKDEIQKKYNNMFVTYKRIKRRNNESGRDATKWDYFKIFDEVYGPKHYLSPPIENNLSVTLTELNTSSDEDDDLLVPLIPPAKKQRKSDMSEILEFLSNEAKEEERRHQELMQLEKERINVLKEFKNILLRLVE